MNGMFVRLCLISAMTATRKWVSRLPMRWHWHCFTIAWRCYRCWYVISIVSTVAKQLSEDS